jgi:chromate transporter
LRRGRPRRRAAARRAGLTTPIAPPRPPTRGEAFRYWLRLGCISFGGPAGQIALMHRELVDEKRWISEQRFLHALNYCMVLPGPEAQQLATYIGWLLHRTWGGVVAGALFVLPSLVVLVALSWLYLAFGNVPAVAGILYGIKPAVTAIVLQAAWRIGGRALRHPVLWAVAAAAFVAIFAFGVPFPAIVAGAGLVGAIGGRMVPAAFAAGSGHRGTGGAHPPAVIDDDTPTPAHARFRWSRLARVAGVCIALWLVALALLVAAWGPGATLPRMGWFFTKAALLTFGGAYAVLPYVYQGAVETYAWLTPAQMIDGLALGETTPGPLIMVVAFVGFVGGWTRQVFGPDALAVAGIAAAAVATFFTFLPSFLFILAGGPLVESTHGRIRYTAPLTGITAAVVGVIVNLALFFAWHVLWPQGWDGRFEWPAAAIGAAAAAALFRFRAGVIPVILACGAAGLGLAFVRA